LATAARWLAVVGIGEDGVDGLGATARRLIDGAEVVFGGQRHLALAAPLIRGDARVWPRPFDPGMAEVLALRGRPVCVLASGDPFLHGVGGTLAQRLDRSEMLVVPAASAFSLAAARLGWPLQDVESISLHGGPPEAVLPLLHPGRRVLALTSDGAAPARIARVIAAAGFGPSRLTVLESLGGPEERHREATAVAFGWPDCAPLNLLAIEVVAGPGARVIPLTPGLPDDAFEHDGQVSKREIRALALAALAPRRGECLWDVGAASGSVAIEWLLRHPSLAAFAVEGRPDRAARMARNAAALGVPQLRVVEGSAPAALDRLPAPDAVFLGGGSRDTGVLDAVTVALRPRGRLVAHAVTLETQALVLDAAARLGGALTTISVARSEPLGGMTAWRPAMPVTQWTWVKP
jgi:precorrin-6B C5,15-methyltransferase / cobalt-precorrin-6B C5,C15-methyltransferase